MKRLLLFLVVAVGLGFGQPTPVVYEQFFTDVGAVPTTSAAITNIGQGAHFVVLHYKDNPPNVCAVPAGNPNVGMQYSYDNVQWFDNRGDTLFVAGPVAVDTIGNLRQWVSFANTYPYIRFNVTAFDTVNCLLDGWYSGMIDGQKVRFRVARGDGVDNLTNEQFGFAVSRNRSGVMLATAPMVFDGATWDRLLDSETSLPIIVGAVTTLEVVPLTDTEVIYVNSFSITLAAAGSAQWVTGTGANCAAGQTNLTGAYALGQGVPLVAGTNIGRLFVVPVSQALCLTTVGAGATAAGLLTYAQY